MTSVTYPEHETLVNSMPQITPSQRPRRTSRSSGSTSGCRSSRIEKPKSNHNSPRVLERRKTTTSTKRYTTLDDHYNMMFGLTGEEEAAEEQRDAPRPLSWHPSSTQFQVPSRSSAFEPAAQPDYTRHHSTSSRNSHHGSDFYSLSARNSMHNDQMQNMPSLSQHHESNRDSQSSDSSWQDVSQQQSNATYALSAYSTPATEPMPWYLQEWARRNQAADSGHGSSDFLPIQHPSNDQDKDAEMEDGDVEEEKELVGMGLYDPPETDLGWSSMGLNGGTGKGLKLEETWQPPEEDDDEDAEAENDDASSDDGSVEELPAKEPERKLPLDAKQQMMPQNMTGQSFFFDEDETYTKEWWFQQLKQPTVRDTGLGYGWL